MTHHWPIAVSALLISGALALGMYQHENAISSSALKTPDSTPVAVAPAPATAAQPAQNDAVPNTGGPVAPPPAEQPTSTIQPNPAQPTPVQNGTVDVTKPVITKPIPALPLAGKPGTPGAPTGAPHVTDVLAELRKALQLAVDVPTIPLPGGGFAFSPLGARIDVLPPPNWSISIYNVNGKTPEVETDSYKQIIQTVTSTLAIDMSPTPVVSESGKSSLKTSCKLGRISLDRDPGNAQVIVLTPLQPRVQ